jgi:hypothetical protein
MSALDAFGLFSVTLCLICYTLETRSHWYIMGFTVGCVLCSVYGFAQGAWPFGVIEAIWTVVSLRRWLIARKAGVGLTARKA